VRWPFTQGAARLDVASPSSSRKEAVTCEERDAQQHYEIRVRGHLGPRMLRAFPALAAQTRGEDTLLTGCLPDQAAVYGVIAKLEAFGLELLEFCCLPR
jgi:hypothetical protein